MSTNELIIHPGGVCTQYIEEVEVPTLATYEGQQLIASELHEGFIGLFIILGVVGFVNGMLSQ